MFTNNTHLPILVPIFCTNKKYKTKKMGLRSENLFQFCSPGEQH
jgi:hypothetical protein